MKGSDKTIRFLSLSLFGAGIVLAAVLTILALWPDFEAALFDITHSDGESLNSLRCPLVITPLDEAAIRLKLTNPLDQPINFLARARISEGFMTLMRQENAQTRVQPGESVEFAWAVKPEDAVYGRMILARAQVLRTNTLPARQKACGILVLQVPFMRGNQIVTGLLVATLACLAVGGWLWLKHERPLTGRKRELTRIAGLFTLLLLLTMVVSLAGWWGGGVFMIIVMVLIFAAFFERLA